MQECVEEIILGKEVGKMKYMTGEESIGEEGEGSDWGRMYGQIKTGRKCGRRGRKMVDRDERKRRISLKVRRGREGIRRRQAGMI